MERPADGGVSAGRNISGQRGVTAAEFTISARTHPRVPTSRISQELRTKRLSDSSFEP